jgi:hypothetical protein
MNFSQFNEMMVELRAMTVELRGQTDALNVICTLLVNLTPSDGVERAILNVLQDLNNQRMMTLIEARKKTIP